MLNVRRLGVLAAAVRERSISGAARSLGITPSAASQAIGALEAQAGTSLLQRRTRGVVPTAAGERLAAHAEAVLAQLATAEAELSPEVGGVLRVAAFATAVGGLLPAVVCDLRSRATAPAVRVFEVEPDGAREALRAGEVDLALVNHHAVIAPDASSPWRVLHVLDEPVLAVLPAGHRHARRAHVDVSALAGDDWVMQAAASPCQDLVLRVCAVEGFAPAVSATCGDYRSIVRLVAAEHGVSLVPELALDAELPAGVAVIPPRVPITRRVNALVQPDQAERPAVRTFLGALRDVVAQRAAGQPHPSAERSAVIMQSRLTIRSPV